MGIIVSAGCSYAAGYGLENRADRYANLLAKRTGFDLIDMSTSGASNDYIASCAVTGVNIALERAPAKEIVLIVGWTTQSRLEYYDNDVNLVLSIMTAYRGPGYDIPVGDIPREKLARALWHPAYGYYRFLCGFQRVESFCREVGVKVIHLNNINVHPIKFVDAQNEQSRFRQPIIMDKMMSPQQSVALGELLGQQSFQVYCNSRKFLDGTVHPTPPGHADWAQKIIDKHGDTLGI